MTDETNEGRTTDEQDTPSEPSTESGGGNENQQTDNDSVVTDSGETAVGTGNGTGRRAVVVDGVRTPFVKAFGPYLEMDTIELGTEAVGGLLDQNEVPRNELDKIVWGSVIVPGYAPNVAREIALDMNLTELEGKTVSRACASGLQSVTDAVAAIERGNADVVIAGGSDSTSNAEIKLPQKLTRSLAKVSYGKQDPAEILGILSQLTPITDLLPKAPEIAERTTGEVMGEAAERMAERHGVSREEQDEFAVRSHHRAAEAIASGRFDDEVTPVETPDGEWVHRDRIVRGDTDVEQLSRLSPAFKKNGTLTAANSTPLTDGAASVLLMSEEKADELGIEPKAAFKSWSYCGVDPSDQLLMGPALALPEALNDAGMVLDDLDLIDLHEAFAAQVLCVLRMLESDAFARRWLDREEAAGSVDMDKLNVHGGSVAIGHPFAATGARMTTTMANELSQESEQTAGLGICAAGGLGAGAIMESVS
ncbi:MAG: acetyl-CoA C-acyltransferase [bacterium]